MCCISNMHGMSSESYNCLVQLELARIPVDINSLAPAKLLLFI